MLITSPLDAGFPGKHRVKVNPVRGDERNAVIN
jgi:hypothetical protein